MYLGNPGVLQTSSEGESRFPSWKVHHPTNSQMNFCMSNQSIAYYRMVGNFREGFIFVLFGSQEPFAKIKDCENFVVHV